MFSGGPACRWLVFNDEKVQECPDPPLECGYLYFYRRST
jgi:hypothetical protein